MDISSCVIWAVSGNSFKAISVIVIKVVIHMGASVKVKHVSIMVGLLELCHALNKLVIVDARPLIVWNIRIL